MKMNHQMTQRYNQDGEMHLEHQLRRKVTLKSGEFKLQMKAKGYFMEYIKPIIRMRMNDIWRWTGYIFVDLVDLENSNKDHAGHGVYSYERRTEFVHMRLMKDMHVLVLIIKKL